MGLLGDCKGSAKLIVLGGETATLVINDIVVAFYCIVCQE